MSESGREALAPTRVEREIHRSPPYSDVGEQGVIASMLLSPREAIADVIEHIDQEYFYIPAHQTLFSILIELWRAGTPIDLITFTQVLRDRNLLDSVGGTIDGQSGPGAFYVTALYSFVPTAANLGHYVQIVREKFVLRQIIAAGTEAVRRAYEEQDDVEETLEAYQVRAIEIGHVGRGESTTGPLSKYVPAALAEIIWHYHNRGKPAGISTGFVDMDRMMNGFERGKRPYCYAARPSMGKTSLMLAFAKNIALAAVAQRKRVGIFSIEMTAQSLAKRLLVDEASVMIGALRNGFMEDEAKPRLQAAAEKFMTDWILVDEKGDLSIVDFISRARRWVVKDKVDIIMVDYLQRMKGSSKRSRENRQLEINEICMGLSETAKELKVPIVVLAQLNRNPEDRKDGRPELGDLRESGSIEQEMGFVGLLWRPSYYTKNDPDKIAEQMKKLGIQNEEDFDQYSECIVEKQNEGPTGPIPLRFIKDFARYVPDDPNRPLFSTNLAKRQQKPGEPKPVPAEEKAEKALTQQALEMFKGKIVRKDDEQHISEQPEPD